METNYLKLKNLTKRFKRVLHRIRIWTALFLGIKKSRMSKLVDCTLFEVRIMALITVLVFGFYLIVDSIIDETETEVFKLMVKFNCLVVLIIIGLMVKILFKVSHKSKCKHPDHCFGDHHHWSHPDHRTLNDQPRCDCPHEHK